jgi:hypothetical protein
MARNYKLLNYIGVHESILIKEKEKTSMIVVG